MTDDLISALTQEVKEEVINNYLYERRLIDEQISYVKELAEHAIQLQSMLCKRFIRMYDLLVDPQFINKFVSLVGLKEIPFEKRIINDPEYRKDVRFIKIRGLTDRSRYRKLFIESYIRLYNWNSQYLEAYKNVEDECKTVNQNLKKFEDKYDLLAILNFLKNMDTEIIAKKYFMGDNFAPEEITSIEKALCFKSVAVKQFNLIPPPDLYEPAKIMTKLTSLAQCVYEQYRKKMKNLIR